MSHRHCLGPPGGEYDCGCSAGAALHAVLASAAGQSLAAQGSWQEPTGGTVDPGPQALLALAAPSTAAFVACFACLAAISQAASAQGVHAQRVPGGLMQLQPAQQST